ncbi:hypothetical protein BDY19DRAFT_962508 [Irpex rosettiformis]|uniref:Uncharacterized protein n=1 Tax=Irpex rosettiformis TaxID=378272 RepID=A0ACB8TVB6_9APHY|nr:hypothetical protein BDY19DRAFT_962508 [Irpex rosettiformis]
MKRPHTAANLDSHEKETCDCQVCARARQRNVITRSKDWWQDDCFVIIHVDCTLYKLYKGQLSESSGFFRRLFEEDTAKRTTVDGCVVYTINKEVTSDDFEAVLECINFKGIRYVFSLPSFTKLVSIFRAASALSFPEPLAFARRAIEAMWSFDLVKVTDTPLQDASIVLQLARNYDLSLDVRKRALYEILRQEDYGVEAEWYTAYSPFAPEPPTATVNGKPSEEVPSSSSSSFIATTDLFILIVARKRVASMWYTTTGSPHGITDFCQNAINGCLAPSEHPVLWNKVVKTYDMCKVGLIDPLKGLQRIREFDWKGEGYCDSCVVALKKWCADEQVRVWKLLGEWFHDPVKLVGGHVSTTEVRRDPQSPDQSTTANSQVANSGTFVQPGVETESVSTVLSSGKTAKEVEISTKVSRLMSRNECNLSPLPASKTSKYSRT